MMLTSGGGSDGETEQRNSTKQPASAATPKQTETRERKIDEERAVCLYLLSQRFLGVVLRCGGSGSPSSLRFRIPGLCAIRHRSSTARNPRLQRDRTAEIQEHPLRARAREWLRPRPARNGGWWHRCCQAFDARRPMGRWGPERYTGILNTTPVSEIHIKMLRRAFIHSRYNHNTSWRSRSSNKNPQKPIAISNHGPAKVEAYLRW